MGRKKKACYNKSLTETPQKRYVKTPSWGFYYELVLRAVRERATNVKFFCIVFLVQYFKKMIVLSVLSKL